MAEIAEISAERMKQADTNFFGYMGLLGASLAAAFAFLSGDPPLTTVERTMGRLMWVASPLAFFGFLCGLGVFKNWGAYSRGLLAAKMLVRDPAVAAFFRSVGGNKPHAFLLSAYRWGLAACGAVTGFWIGVLVTPIQFAIITVTIAMGLIMIWKWRVAWPLMRRPNYGVIVQWACGIAIAAFALLLPWLLDLPPFEGAYLLSLIGVSYAVLLPDPGFAINWQIQVSAWETMNVVVGTRAP